MKRGWLIARRWADITLLAVLGGSIVLVLFALRVSWLLAVLDASAWIVGASGLVVAALVLCSALQSCVGHPVLDDSTPQRWHRVFGGLVACAGLKHCHAYPPTWFAGLLGAAGLLSLLNLFSGARELLQLPTHLEAGLWLVVVNASVFLSAVVATAALAPPIIAAIERLTPKRSTPDSQSASTRPPASSEVGLTSSWDRLRRWLLDDKPVTQSRDALFGHAAIARRIASRLQQIPAPAQVVVGGLGTGKTTLRCLVQHELRSRTRIHIVPIELWPFETPQAAVEGVLRALMQSMAREVDTLAARGLPERYVEVMTAAGGFAAQLTKVDGKPKTPLAVLAIVDKLATAIGHRFVIWVEDLERFARASDGEESLENSQRLAPLRALLFGLSELRSISVVTATTSLHARFDTQKIARYVENVPPVKYSQAALVLQTFRAACMSRHYIDPADPKARKDWKVFDSPDRLEAQIVFGRGIATVPDAAVSLCRTPRSMKQGLRRALEYWETHTGEIDLDDLLVMHLLRVAEPGAFALIGAHWRGLVDVRRSDSVNKTAQEAFDSALGDLNLPAERNGVVDAIVKGVLQQPKPQGLSRQRYWSRFLSDAEIEREDEDQPVLRTLRGDDDDALLVLLEGPQSDQVETFLSLVSARRWLRRLVPLVKRRASENPATWQTKGWGAESNPPGLIPLWRILLTAAPDKGCFSTDEVAKEIKSALREALPCFPLLNKLEHYYLGSGDGHSPLEQLDRAQGGQLVKDIREDMWRHLVERYAGKPDDLRDALCGSHPWTLGWVVWGSERKGQKTCQGVPFADWGRFASTLLEACRNDPALMLPSLAALVTGEGKTTYRDGERTAVYAFDGTQAAALFGSEAAVLELFVAPVEVADDARDIVGAVNRAALQSQQQGEESST